MNPLHACLGRTIFIAMLCALPKVTLAYTQSPERGTITSDLPAPISPTAFPWSSAVAIGVFVILGTAVLVEYQRRRHTLSTRT